MRNKILGIFLIFLLLVVVMTACTDNNELKTIEISIHYTDDNIEYFINDIESISVIEGYIGMGIEQDGIVDYVTPSPIELVITYSDGSNKGVDIYVYDQDEISSFILVDENHTVYEVSANATDKIKKLLSELVLQP